MGWRLFSIFLCLILWISTVHIGMAQDTMLKRKIGQMLLFGFHGTELRPHDVIVKAILAQQIGGVVLFDYDNPTKIYDRNIKNPTQLQHLTQQLQNYAQQSAANNKNDFIPLFIGIDYEGGSVNRLKERYGFPKTLSPAEIGVGSVAQATQYARQMAHTLKAVGVNMNFAPLIDVDVNPNNPIIGKMGRSFSSNPKTVADYAAIFSKAYQDEGIVCTYKHFPGHGSSTGDTHTSFVDVTKTWQKYELEPYLQLLKQSYGCPAVMTAHVVHYELDPNGYPASISSAMITDLLRHKLNFNGVVISDDLQMKAIADYYGLEEAIRLAINAGADMLIFANQLVPTPQDPEKIVDIIYQNVVAGKISVSRIDEAYHRIVKLKKKIQTNSLTIVAE